MPYAFLLIGLALAITAIEGTYKAFASELKADLTGKDGFLVWALAIVMVGALGYIDSVRPVSNKLLWLVLIVLFLVHGGAWANLVDAFQKGPVTPKAVAAPGAGAGQGAAATLGPWQTSVQGGSTGTSATIVMGQPKQSGIPGVNELGGIPDLKDSNFMSDIEKALPFMLMAL
jgi:hypothetical protein